jgi:DNA-binding beta-propeller fold protein YncE
MVAGCLLALGCGNQYRPVVSAVNPVGPANQPTKYAVAISNPSASSPGLVTFVDFAGDTVMSTPQILSNPNYLVLGSSGTLGFVINSAGSYNQFGTGNPTGLITSDITQSSLAEGASPISITALTLSGSAPTVFIPEPSISQVAALTSSGSLVQNIAIPDNPIYVVGTDSGLRAYAISEGNGTNNGSVSSIESGNLAVDSTIPVGVNPVYGVMTADGMRAFILNNGSGTVSVLNVVNNGKDLASPTIPATGTLGLHPIWADFAPTNSELVVLNQGDGVNPGSLNIISIPLCSALAQPSNPLCDPNNPVDANGFGTVLATVPVGINPVEVSVLADGSKAYVVNSGNATNAGSVSVVNLITQAVSATIPAGPDPVGTVNTPATDVYGHPNTVAATTGTPTGKVYVTSSDSHYMTVIETDTDVVETHVNLQGDGVRVRVTAQ